MRKKDSNPRNLNQIVNSNLKKAIKDLFLIKNYLIFSVLFFFAIASFGFIFPVFFKEQIISMIQQIILKTQDLGPLELIFFIINNNTTSAFLGVSLGILFGVFPIFTLVVNAYIIGFIASKTVSIKGFSILWRLLPHGIFEIPAILISISLGLWIGNSFYSFKQKLKSVLYVSASLIIFIASLSFLLLTLSSLLTLNNPSINSAESVSENISFIANLPIFSNIALLLFILSFILTTPLLHKADKKQLNSRIKSSIRIFLMIVIPLLVIAGFIEGILIYVLG